MRLLVPLDGSEFGKRVVGFLASRSTLIGSEPEVHLLNVQPMLARRVAAQLGRERTRRIYETEADAVLPGRWPRRASRSRRTPTAATPPSASRRWPRTSTPT